jgi:ethanolamine utilization cobalamin adenosyltransferase
MLHWLNVLRTQAREVEVVALSAGPIANLPQALNRFSSAVYVLELYWKAGKL